MNIKAVIFDLDGTLLDTMFIWNSIGTEYLISRGIQPNVNLEETFESLSLAQAAKHYQDIYGLTESIEDIINDVNKMIEHYYIEIVDLKEGAMETLVNLKHNGVKMCIATATDRYLVEAALKRKGILDYFEGILTCTEVGFGKDNPAIYLKALDLLDTSKNDTIVVEDALYAIRTAKAAGFSVVAVYDDIAKDQQSEIEMRSDYYIKSFKEWSMIYD